MINSVSDAAHVQVWGVDADARLHVLGVVSIDRTCSPWAYTAGADAEQATFHSEPAAAEWLARRYRRYCVHVFIGRRLGIDHDDWESMQLTLLDGVRQSGTLHPGALLAALRR